MRENCYKGANFKSLYIKKLLHLFFTRDVGQTYFNMCLKNLVIAFAFLKNSNFENFKMKREE